MTAAGSATSVRVGETLQLSASVLPAVAPQNVTWSSSDPTKASVDANGLVTGVAEAEEVTITATSSKATVKGEIKLAVAPKASVLAQSITVDASAELVLGGDAKEAMIRKTSITVSYTDNEGEHETDYDDLKLRPFMVCKSGKHQVNIIFNKGDKDASD